MYCPKCGAQNAEGNKICSQCGAALTETISPAAAQPTMVDTRTSGMATASLVLGIMVSFLFYVLYWLLFLGPSPSGRLIGIHICREKDRPLRVWF